MSFNPCFNGSSITTGHYPSGLRTMEHCFNPCFNGSSITTFHAPDMHNPVYEFQSLF